jgi:4-hydroxy-2-oxoheptanedioate aldolase
VTDNLKSILRNNVKEKLAAGNAVSCMSVRAMRSVEIARIAKSSGYDAMYIDMEHNAFSMDATSQICIAALGVGIFPIVRVPSHGSEYVARCLDGGALGIVAPHINNAVDAKKIVSTIKYPPLGKRSVATGLPHLQYRSWPGEDTSALTNEATLVIVQIETREAMANVDEIAAVEGVDILLIGTNDLLADMGLAGKYDDPVVREVFTRTIAATKKYGKHTGIGGLTSRKDLTTEFVKQGALFVSAGTDLSFLISAATGYAKFLGDIASS